MRVIGVASLLVTLAWIGGPTPGGSLGGLVEVFTPTLPAQSHEPAAARERAPAQRVGAVMALLATLDDAHVLPPQGTAAADRVIQAGIQLQAALTKSSDPALQSLLRDAMTTRYGTAATALLSSFQSSGWTVEVLEAVAESASVQPLQSRIGVEDGLRPYHLSSAEADHLLGLFRNARDRFLAEGRDIRRVFAARRAAMPGAGLPPNP